MAEGATIHLAESALEIKACFAVLSELRTHLPPEGFVDRIRRLQRSGYRLAYLEVDGQVVCVAGFRLCENLPWGRFLYVDDLVTRSAARSKGHGRQLLDWLADHARVQGCQELHLDSGVQRVDAHRFYRSLRMKHTSHHFSLDLEEGRR